MGVLQPIRDVFGADRALPLSLSLLVWLVCAPMHCGDGTQLISEQRFVIVRILYFKAIGSDANCGLV